MRRVISLCCVFALLMSTLCIDVAAMGTQGTEVVEYFEDGSYCVIALEVECGRAAGAKNGTKNYSYYSGDNKLLWTVSLTGTFTYSGISSTCTASNVRITIYNDSWYTEYKASHMSANSALGEASMCRKILGVTVEKRIVELTLTCDVDGNLS